MNLQTFPPRFRAYAAGAAILALSLGCANWSQTRHEIVDPIHELLHHEYPKALESQSAEQLAALYADEHVAETANRALLARFREIENAHSEIERVDLEHDPVSAELRLQVEGKGPDGRLLSVQQRKQVSLVRSEAGWRIASDLPTPLPETPTPPVHFVDEAQLRGLWFQHESPRILDREGQEQIFIYGSGSAVIDANDDGWDDVLLLSGDHIELFLNEEGSFRNASKDWGLGTSTGRILTVALPLDLDNDGRRDLFIGAEKGQPLVLRNLGDRFEVITETGIETTGRNISASSADFDGDGLLDLYLANHEDVYWEAPDLPWARNAEADQLYLGNGDGTFRDGTRAARLGNRGWSLSPVAADYDKDGDIDLFVGNDFGLDVFYRNDGQGHFDEVSSDIGVDKPIASMSADWGDFDGDGDLDLFVGGMTSGSAWVLEAPDFRVQKVPLIVDWLFRPYVREAVREWFRGNRFYENQGDGTFVEISAESGAQHSGWAWGTVWLDFDNDGRLDLYGSNGFLSGPVEDDL